MEFRFKCYKKLKLTLGEIDSIVESIELATREFIDTISANGRDKNNIQTNIDKLSIKHQIKVNYVDINKFEDRVIKLHIINVYEQLENYLEELSKEHPDFTNHSGKNSGETDLDFTIRILKKGKILKNDINYFIINHYRLIRNKFVHSLDKDLNKFKNRIIIKNTEYSLLSAPNEFNKMNFDDFILFTRAIKNFAKLINQLCQPTDEQIVEFIKKDNLSKLNKLSNNTERKKNLIEQLLKIEYNIFNETLVSKIMKD